jgi:hypothetical protein
MTYPFRRRDGDHTVIWTICFRVVFIIASLTVPDILMCSASPNINLTIMPS